MHPYSQRKSESVAAWGEQRLIAALRHWLGPASPPAPAGIGDDCAVLAGSRRPQLMTVDPMIYGRHFDSTIPPRYVGAKLLKRNLSDLAAMGARPTAAVVALMLDAKTSRAWLEQFYRGLAAAARRFGVPIVGGDVAEAAGVIAASLTLLGAASGSRVVTRSGAKIGDWIYVTGVLGQSLRSGHHYRFTPRLAEGSWLAAQREVRAMMDLSDGLAKDVHALTPRSGSPALDPASIPLRAGADLRAALGDGEDYELLVVLAKQTDRAAFARKWHRAFPRVRLSCLGRFVPLGAMPPGVVRLAAHRGFEHLR